jgi:two-component system, LytTR family, response regulator
METIKTIIIDDERLARKELTSLLANFPFIDIIAEGKNVDEGKELIEEHQPDLIFLDIQMPGKNGFELLEELDKVPQVIFVTAYDEYAIKAFEVNAFDYLLKPIQPERLESTLDKLKQEINELKKQEKDSSTQDKLSLQDKIFLKDGEKCWFVELNDVRLFESEGNYVRVYFNEFKPLILRSLNALEDRLDEKEFFRASRKHIVNLRWVDKIENWFNGGLLIILKDGQRVEVSRRQAAKFKDMMSL